MYASAGLCTPALQSAVLNN